VKQSEIFLNGEGNNWFLRNREALDGAQNHDISFLARNLPEKRSQDFQFLEIGCSNGVKTEQLSTKLNWRGFGIDPSELAIEDARSRTNNCSYQIGTAEKLPFEDGSFNLCYYAFCLYLVDRSDLHFVFKECARVLREVGYVAILDFDYGDTASSNTYKHDSRVVTYKEQYAAHLFKMGFQVSAKESYSEGKIGVASNPDCRVSITLFSRL
jgi:ubiquinone/menaquinone biosynthesis C-methylase UbiE